MSLARQYRVVEWAFWSPMMGCDAVRISIADENGAEYFALIERLEGQAGRDAKKKAVRAIEMAIEQGLSPGEVRWK